MRTTLPAWRSVLAVVAHPDDEFGTAFSGHPPTSPRRQPATADEGRTA
jgi:hypothetical protein